MHTLPYRRNVAAVIYNAKGEIFIALRHDLAREGIWSFPQGGIDSAETPEEALKRELMEEIGTDKVRILQEYPEWLSYDFPGQSQRNPLKEKYKGQTQKWFAVEFLGKDSEINLDQHEEKEFDEWKWIAPEKLSLINTGFKKTLYLKIVDYFNSSRSPS